MTPGQSTPDGSPGTTSPPQSKGVSGTGVGGLSGDSTSISRLMFKTVFKTAFQQAHHQGWGGGSRGPWARPGQYRVL